MRIIKGDKDINFGSIYENAVAQELVAHGIVPYYYNNKKRGELDFVIELGGKVLPIEVKSGKTTRRTAHCPISWIVPSTTCPKLSCSITTICVLQARWSMLPSIWRCFSKRTIRLRRFTKWTFLGCDEFLATFVIMLVLRVCHCGNVPEKSMCLLCQVSISSIWKVSFFWKVFKML